MKSLDMGKWKKQGIVFSPDKIPGRINGLGASVEPLDDGAWRLWFDTDIGNEKNFGISIGKPGQPCRRVLATLTEGKPAETER